MKGKSSWCLCAGLLLTLGVINLHAAVLVSGSAVGSDSGFGAINYSPGDNVDEFIIYGRANGSAPYIRSDGVHYINPGVSGDGQTVDNNYYEATYYTWDGGTPTASGTWYTESAQPLAGGYGVTPYTWASISLQAPSDSFDFSFFAHDYYAAVDLEVWVDGVRYGYYDNVMSSSYLPGGGEGRNTDYYYQFSLSGVTVGNEVEFRFANLENLGSGWANIAFMSAGLNYTAPEGIQNTLFNMENMDEGGGPGAAVPEPSTLTLFGFAALALRYGRRHFLKLQPPCTA